MKNTTSNCDRAVATVKAKPIAIDVTSRRTFTITEAATILGIGKNTLYNAAKTGGLNVIRIGGRTVVPRRTLERLLGGNLQDGADLVPDNAEPASAQPSDLLGTLKEIRNIAYSSEFAEAANAVLRIIAIAEAAIAKAGE